MNYLGDTDTRPQSVRLRAANTPAALTSSRPIITPTGFLRANGTMSSRARGVVRVQLQYINRVVGETVTIERLATIQNGRWSLNVELPPAVLAIIAGRCGNRALVRAVHGVHAPAHARRDALLPGAARP